MPSPRARGASLALALGLWACVAVAAEDRAPASSEPEAGAPASWIPARFRDPVDGELDLSEYLAKARGFLPIPLIVTEPAVGYGGGMAAMFLRPRHEAGEEGWTRPDISGVGALATTNGTWAAFAGDSSIWREGRLRTLVGAGTGRVNLDFYGLGNSRPDLDQALSYSLDFGAVIAQADWRLGTQSSWWTGLRYVYASVRPTLQLLPFSEPRVTISAPTVLLTYDSRDNIFTPTRGVYSETSVLASREGLGGSVDFERAGQVLIGWWPVAEKLTLGLRADLKAASESTPFFLRPFVAMRGVPAMRYPGERVASVEAELRWQAWSRWSVLAFGGSGYTRTERGRLEASNAVAAGGIGLRYELARRFGLHVGIDLAGSPGTRAFYIQVGSAWFRP